jgi:hypothetical protein
MTLLQLDMLAYLKPNTPEPTAVIGGGIPSTWLGRPMTIRGIPFPSSSLDWMWDGVHLDVMIRGKRLKIEPGPLFPPNTTVRVRWVP